MRVSVILCTYSSDMYDHFMEAAESVLGQTYPDVELVIVVDGNETLYERAEESLGHLENVVLHLNENNRGLLVSRNTGVEIASGDIVAFLDDDAIAEEHWIDELLATYEETDAIAAGGRVGPEWLDRKPEYLPEEFYWLVGVTHRGFADGPQEVRNTFGSNLSFRREVFLELGGFDPTIGGRKADVNLQGGETELCARMRSEFGQGVMYNPNAVVHHKIFDYRTDFFWLLDRAFWQGYSKRAMEVILSDAGEQEQEFLGRLLREFLPGRLKSLLYSPSLVALEQLLMLLLLTGTVGTGYLYGTIKWRSG